MKITVIILTHHRLELVRACLKSIEEQHFVPYELEIVALLNGQDQETFDYLQNYQNLNESFKFSALDQSVPVGEARNILIEHSTGEYICFIDDDVELPPNYFKLASQIIENDSQIDVFGGPDQMKDSSSVFQEVLSSVMESFFAMGPTAKRHSKKFQVQKGSEINLILCNLWMKKEIFSQGYKFPSGFRRNEENILIAHLQRDGKKLIYNPELFVYHERKSSIKKLIKVTYLSGQFRTYGFFKEPATFNFVFMIPQIFLSLFIIFRFMGPAFIKVYCLAYLLTICLIAIFLVRRKFSIPKAISAMLILMSYHFSYSIGQFSGYVKKLREVL